MMIMLLNLCFRFLQGRSSLGTITMSGTRPSNPKSPLEAALGSSPSPSSSRSGLSKTHETANSSRKDFPTRSFSTTEERWTSQSYRGKPPRRMVPTRGGMRGGNSIGSSRGRSRTGSACCTKQYVIPRYVNWSVIHSNQICIGKKIAAQSVNQLKVRDQSRLSPYSQIYLVTPPPSSLPHNRLLRYLAHRR